MALGVVILAAGQGTRMKSALPKVLHPLAGRPMVFYSIEAARPPHFASTGPGRRPRRRGGPPGGGRRGHLRRTAGATGDGACGAPGPASAGGPGRRSPHPLRGYAPADDGNAPPGRGGPAGDQGDPGPADRRRRARAGLGASCGGPTETSSASWRKRTQKKRNGPFGN